MSKQQSLAAHVASPRSPDSAHSAGRLAAIGS
jgi:hypothetical protein